MTEVAHASVGVDLNDERLVAGLRRVDAEFNRTMDRIGRSKATAEADLSLARLDDKLAQAKRKLREFQAEKATATTDVDIAKAEAKIEAVKRSIKSLDGRKAVIEYEVRGGEKVLAYNEKLSKSFRDAEAAAQKAFEAQRRRQYDQEVGSRREVMRILQLQKEYARLTDRLERLNKQNPIGKEARAKVVLDATHVFAKMEALKAELNFLGAHPPVDIKANVNEKGLARIRTKVTGTVAAIANKLSGLSDLSIRLGPFTTSLRGLGLALAYLGPTITDLVGAAGSLVGVLGAGVSGAAAVGSGGIVALGADFLGLKFSMRNTMQEVANVRLAYNALQKAQQKGDPKKLKTAQDNYNNTLKNVSPLARNAAVGIERFFSTWDAHTARTRANLAQVAHDGFQALNRLTPMWARQTNKMSTALADGLHTAFKYLSQGDGRRLLSGILNNFNNQIPTILHALGSLGQAFLNFANEGSKHFGGMAKGFDDFATHVLNFTKRDDFHQTVSRWVQDAGDVLRFLGNLSKVIVHFFGDGSQAGDEFVKTMDHALKRWDKFITSADGKNKLGDWFRNSVQGTEELYNALRPIVQLFALWATGLEPFVTAITKIATFVTKAAESMGRLVGLGNPLATLGTTLGAMFAVSKIGGFVAMLSRGVGLMRSMARDGELLRGIFSGDLWRGMRAGGGIAAAAKEGAASFEASILSASESGAAMYAESLRAGGATVAGEIKAAEIEGGAIAAEEEAAGTAGGGLGGFGKGGGLISTLGRAVGGLGLGLGALVGLAGAAGVAALVFGGRAKDAADKVNDLSKATRNAAVNVQKDVGGLNGAYTDLANSTNNVKEANLDVARAQKALDKTKQGTAAYTAALQALNSALDRQRAAQAAVIAAQRKASGFHADLLKAERQHIAANKEWGTALQKLVPDMKSWIDLGGNFQKVTGKKTVDKVTVDDLIKYGDQIKTVDGHEKQWAKDVAALRKAHNDLVNSENNSANATQAYANAQVNARRALMGFEPLARGAREQMDRLVRSIGHSRAVQIGVKFPNPQQAGRVMSQMNSAIASGTPKSRVFDVVANSRTAEQALRRLNSIRLTPKRLEIMERGGDLAVRMIQRILGVNLPPKVQNIIQQGGEKARAALLKLLGTNLPPKLLRILGDDTDAKNKARDANNTRLNPLRQPIIRTAPINPPNLLTVPPAYQDIYRRMHGFPHASGLRPGGARHNALIGEGRGPEWHYNTRSGMAYRTSGPMSAHLGPHDAIIPTEPAYRQRGRDILREIARDLGMRMYAGGKHHKAAPKPKPPHVNTSSASTMTAPAAHRHLATVKDYSAAAVPVDWIQNKYDNAAQKVKSDETKKKDLESQRKTALKTTTDKNASKHEKAKAASHANDLLKQIHKLERDIADTKKLRDDYKDKLDKLNAANAQIAHLNSRISTDKTLMDNASTAYDKDPQQKYIDNWTSAQADRGKAITALKNILNKALTLAKSVKHMPGEGAYIDQLAGEISDLGGTELDNNQAVAPATDSQADLDSFIKSLGLTDQYKKAIADFALAKTNNLPDDPGTAAREDLDSLKDDLAASGSLMGILNTVLGKAKATGNNDLIASAADAFSSARDDYNNINDQFTSAATATGPSQVDLMDTARADLYKNYGSNFNPSFGQSGPSGVGSAGMQANVSLAPDVVSGAAASRALGPNVTSGAGAASVTDSTGPATTVNNVTNHFSAPPADPHTWSQGVAFELGAMV